MIMQEKIHKNLKQKGGPEPLPPPPPPKKKKSDLDSLSKFTC